MILMITNNMSFPAFGGQFNPAWMIIMAMICGPYQRRRRTSIPFVPDMVLGIQRNRSDLRRYKYHEGDFGGSYQSIFEKYGADHQSSASDKGIPMQGPSQVNEHTATKRSSRAIIAGAAAVALLIGATGGARHLLPRITAPIVPERVSEGDTAGPKIPVAQAEKREQVLVAALPATSRTERASPDIDAAQPVLPEATSLFSPADVDSAAPVARSGTAGRALAGEQQTPRAPPPTAAGDGEIALLRARGDELLAIADIVSARLMYRRAASLGSAAAMTALAGTYDPLLTVSRNVPGFQRPEPREAISWYRRAAVAGDADAAQRLRFLVESLRRSGQLDADEAATLVDAGKWQAE
jgi:hypothetical protein